MGVFFYTHNVALAEDLSLSGKYDNLDAFYAEVDASYQQVHLEHLLYSVHITLFFLS